MVRAALPMGEQRLLLSNLDLLLPHVDVSVFLCYNMPRKQNSLPFAPMTRILQNSLGQTLVSFYPLAGEVVMGSRGEPELLCNNRGVDFMEAYADVELRELQLYNLDASMEGKLMPKNMDGDGVLCIQATELRCGAVIVACTFYHRIADAYSINMFMVAWAEITHSKTISLLPSFQRSLLNPRRPRSCDASMDNVHAHVNTVSSSMADLRFSFRWCGVRCTRMPTLGSASPPPTHAAPMAHPIISCLDYMTAENMAQFQALASSRGCRRTKLESLGAYLWQIVAKSEINKAKRCKMGVVVDGRMRLCDENNSMANYFGNMLSTPFGQERVEELMTKPFSLVADAVHEYVHAVARKEYFLGLIDWVEALKIRP